MAKKVEINSDACIGCGLCNATLASVFGMTDEGKAEVIAQPAEGDDVETVAASCPVGAITVSE